MAAKYKGGSWTFREKRFMGTGGRMKLPERIKNLYAIVKE